MLIPERRVVESVAVLSRPRANSVGLALWPFSASTGVGKAEYGKGSRSATCWQWMRGAIPCGRDVLASGWMAERSLNAQTRRFEL